MAGGSPDPQGEVGLPGNRPRRGDMGGSGGDSKSPFHSLHNLPRNPPWFQGRSRHGYRHPRGQAVTTACDLEGGGLVSDLPGPVQSVIHLAQVQEDHVQDLLPQGLYLLEQLGLESGGTCAATHPETVEDVVVGDGGCETAI